MSSASATFETLRTWTWEALTRFLGPLTWPARGIDKLIDAYWSRRKAQMVELPNPTIDDAAYLRMMKVVATFNQIPGMSSAYPAATANLISALNNYTRGDARSSFYGFLREYAAFAAVANPAIRIMSYEWAADMLRISIYRGDSVVNMIAAPEETVDIERLIQSVGGVLDATPLAVIPSPRIGVAIFQAATQGEKPPRPDSLLQPSGAGRVR